VGLIIISAGKGQMKASFLTLSASKDAFVALARYLLRTMSLTGHSRPRTNAKDLEPAV
jgi:hypothetical protein